MGVSGFGQGTPRNDGGHRPKINEILRLGAEYSGEMTNIRQTRKLIRQGRGWFAANDLHGSRIGVFGL